MDVMRAVELWLADGESDGDKPKTINDRRLTMARFCWWLGNEPEMPVTLLSVTPETVREFLTYLRAELPAGKARWGSDHPAARKRMRPASINAYYRCLRAFLNWCRREELLRHEPLKNVGTPRIPRDQIQPFSPEQQQALLDGARRLAAPARNVAILKVLFDTGLRVSELCSLDAGDLAEDGSISVVGKGGKRRTVYVGRETRKDIVRYLTARDPELPPDESLFAAEGPNTIGKRLTPSGVQKMMARAGQEAQIRGVRVSPHTCRHTFAVSFLRAGGSVLELQGLLGHEDLATLQIYVRLAEADLQKAHRQASPVDRLNLH